VRSVVKAPWAAAAAVAARRRWRGTVPAVLAVFVVGVLLAGPAGADQIGTLQAQADRLASAIASGTARIGVLTRQYDEAAANQAAVSVDLASAQSALDATKRSIAAASGVLRHEAVTAYMGNNSGSPLMAPLASAAMALVLRNQYLQVANGNLADALDRFHVGVHDLQQRETVLRQDQAAATSAAGRVTAARQSALAAATQAEAALAQVHGQLAQLVVQAEAAKAAKAAAPAASPQGLPVAGGLSAAVASAVSAPLAPAPSRTPVPPAPVVAPPTTTVPVTTPAPPPPPVLTGGAGGVWAALRQCESSGNYAENTGNGYFGAYQFSQATWTSLGYAGRPDQAPPAVQDQAAQRLQARSGWGQWPACAAALGLI
jgi:hypothetical protein